MDVDEEGSTGEFRDFINDDALSMRSSASGYRGPPSEMFEDDRPRAAYSGGDAEDQGRAKKRVRGSIRELDPMREIGLLRNYKRRMPEYLHGLQSVCNEPAPYTWFCNFEHPHDTVDVHVQPSIFLTASHASLLNNTEKMYNLARKFADYGDQTHHAKEQPLRQLDTLMAPTDAHDPMHYPAESPVSEMICANNIVNQRNEIDRQPCDSIRGELVLKGDFYTQKQLRDGYCRGGLPGLPSVTLFRINDATPVVEVHNNVLRILKYWNVGTSRPELMNEQNLDVQNPFVEFYYDNKKRFKNARVCIDPMDQDVESDQRAFRRHVHPTIMAKLDEPHVHACRQDNYSSTSGKTDFIKNSRFSCAIFVIPHKVRDSTGKIRNVIVSGIRIRSMVPGCDPIVALRSLTVLQGFSQELINITQHMMHCLNFSGGASIDQLFDTALQHNKHNLASIGHEANMGLAFFGYLKNQCIITRECSVQAACYDQKFRINIFDKQEVSELMEFLELAHYSRKQYYAQVVLHTCHDMSNSKSAKLPLPITGDRGVDWRQFFPGMHWKAVRKDALRQEYAQNALDDDGGDFEEFLALHPDPDYVFFPCDGASFKSGYLLLCQSKIRSEDSPEILKLQAQLAMKEGMESLLITDTREISPVHFCSKRFELFSMHLLASNDPYAIFLDPELGHVPHTDTLQRNEASLTLTERTLLGHMTIPVDDGVRMQRGQIKTKMIETAYGLRGSAMHAQIAALNASCDCATLLEQTVHVIWTKLKDHLHFGVNCTMPQLNHGARFVLDLARVDEDPPCTEAGESITDQHLTVHRKTASGIPNDDSQVARREIENFRQFKSELNSVNESIVRLLLCAHPSLWSCTNNGVYGYCFQICDGGNSYRVQIIKGGKLSDDFVEFDLKSPGSGADMVWNIFGEIVNAFPKSMALVHTMREFFTANTFCELYQQKSTMSFKRTNGIAKNIRGVVMDSLSEHNKNFGIAGAMLELNKQEQSKEQIAGVWPILEAGLGQSGVTENGVKQSPYCTTISGVVVNIQTLNPLQLLLLASNLLSVERPPSVNEGSRVVPVTAGSCDSLGRIVHQQGDDALVSMSLAKSRQPARPFCLSIFTGDIAESNDPLPIDDNVVSRHMSMFLFEYLTRTFAMVHRGLCLHRRVNLGWGLFTWRHVREYCMHLTTNMRKATYTPDDKMARNMNGTLETLVFGKWVRCILSMSLHRRLVLTERTPDGTQRTQLQHVLSDAVVAMILVPVTVTAVLSALQLYLSMVVLDVSVMIVSCMVLFYNRLPHSCPMHVMALAIRDETQHLSEEETRQYHSFAQYLHGLLLTGLVSENCMAKNLSAHETFSLIEMRGDPLLVNRCTEEGEASCCINTTFFDTETFKRELVEGLGGTAVCAHAFASQQARQPPTSPATMFWTNVVPATRLPIPTNKVNERNHKKFTPPHQCGFFYTDVCSKLRSDPSRKAHFGAVVNFLRTCKVQSDVTRFDLVMRLLGPWASAKGVDLKTLRDALHRTGELASDWARPIFNSLEQIDASMLQFALNLQFKANSWEYKTQVGLCADVLWLLVSQALYAVRWESTPQQRVSVVHTSNMSHAAQGLLYLLLHTSIPMCAVPACVNGRVMLTEPSLDPADAGQALGVPYRASLHVDAGTRGAGFLNGAMREPRQMRVAFTAAGNVVLLSRRMQILDRENGDIGATLIQECDICPYPPESVAHMLSSVPSLMRVFRSMHRQWPELNDYAESKWAIAVRLFAGTADAQSLMHIPVALTEHALQEEIPCVTFKHGFCFVVRIYGGMVHVRPVSVAIRLAQYNEDKTLFDHSSFQTLPLSEDQEELSFPAELLSYAMTSGLVICDRVAKFRPPDILVECQTEAETHPIPFAFMPVIRFQALLLLELLDQTHDIRRCHPNYKRAYPETEAATLTVAVLNTRPGSSEFMRNGRYHVEYFDTDATACHAEPDFIFTSQCLLRDGRRVFYTFTAAEYTHMLDTIDDNHKNKHVRADRKFALEKTVPTRDGFTLECFYTLSDQPYRERLEEVMVQIAFVVKETNKPQEVGTIMYFDVNLFDHNKKARLHIITPEEPSTVVTNFYWQTDLY